MYGIWSTAHAIGEGLTFVGVAGLVTLWGWRAGFWGPGVLCIVIAGVLYIYMQDRPQTVGLPPVADWRNDHSGESAAKKVVDESTWAIQRSILKIPAIWVLAMASASIYVTRYAINSWGVLYLQEAKGYTLMQAGSVISVNTISGILGALAFGYTSDKIFNARRPPTNMIFAAMEIVGLLMVFFGPPGKPVFMTVAFLIYGFGLTGLVTSLGGLFALDIAPKRAAGAAMGFIGVFSYIGAALQDQISGHLIERGVTIIEGVRHYDFSTVIWFWVGSSVLSFVLATSLWRVHVRD
jgi:OPA family sugar phosphate sensor protein UhpC-like MFS transporter